MNRARADHVVVLGGGHNGLTAAAMLARSGRKVTLIEARETLGGLAGRFEIAPGYHVPGLYEDTSLVRPWVLQSLQITLERSPRAPIVLCDASDAGREIVLSPDDPDGLSGDVDPADKTAWAAFRGFIEELRPVLGPIFDRAPLSSADSLWTLARTALSVRRLGKSTMMELVRVMPMCVADLLRDTFSDEHLRAGLSYGALEGCFTGPWSAHTALNLLLREVLSADALDGGGAALVAALEAKCNQHRVVFRTGARATEIVVDRDGVSGVRLSDGELVEAHDVLSTLDPKVTFLELIRPQWLPLEVADAARVYRMRGSTAVLVLALSGPLVTRGGREVRALRTLATLDQVEQAFDAVKYRSYAERPALSLTVPDGADLAPAGHRVAMVRVNSAAYDLEGGWTDEARAGLQDVVLTQLSRCIPDLRDRIVASQLLTPPDIASRYGISGGHLLHGEHAPDQLLSFRPSLSTGRYATPIHGLYIGGGASHPGGGLLASPGALASRAVRAD